MRLKPLIYKSKERGGCVPYLIANMTDSPKPIEGLEITDTTSYDEYDASKMYQKAMDARGYFKAIMAEDRYINPKGDIKALRWINHAQFMKSATIQQICMNTDGQQLSIMLLEVIMPNKHLHAIGLFYNPRSGQTIIIDAVKDRPIKRDISVVFQLYRVMKVCVLFFETTKAVLYPLDGIDFLFEVQAKLQSA